MTELDADDTDGGIRSEIQDAVGVVRREVLKAAGIHAFVDGMLVALVTNLVVTVVGVELPGPDYTRQGVAVALGLLVVVVELWLRTREPLVEQFEGVNPDVEEALRTARDVADDGEETRMARRLYGDVLAGLKQASSTDLVETRRIVASVLVVLVLSVATVQVSVLGLNLVDALDGNHVAPNDGRNPTRDYEGLQDGDAILGEETDVGGGDDDLDAIIGGSAGGSGDPSETDRSYDSGGFSSSGAFEAQQAGFAASDDVENADIIREYNLRIREEEQGA